MVRGGDVGTLFLDDVFYHSDGIGCPTCSLRIGYMIFGSRRSDATCLTLLENHLHLPLENHLQTSPNTSSFLPVLLLTIPNPELSVYRARVHMH